MIQTRIEELRLLIESGNSVTLSAKECAWLLDTHDQMKRRFAAYLKDTLRSIRRRQAPIPNVLPQRSCPPASRSPWLSTLA
jgi:hypothetical protein